MRDSKKYILVESPLLQTIEPVNVTKGKIRYVAVLQQLNEVSHNGVLYTPQVIGKGIEEIDEFIKRGSLVSEMDHPITDNVARILNIFYKNACQKILEVSIEDNKVIGVCENLSNTKGQDLYNLIVNDNIPVGFSLRAVASTSRKGNYRVAMPDITIVTWDVVAKPSFFNCIVKEVVNAETLSGVPIRESFEKIEETTNEILIESCSGTHCSIKKNVYSKHGKLLRTIHELTNVYNILDPDLIPKIVFEKLKDKLKRHF